MSRDLPFKQQKIKLTDLPLEILDQIFEKSDLRIRGKCVVISRRLLPSCTKEFLRTRYFSRDVSLQRFLRYLERPGFAFSSEKKKQAVRAAYFDRLCEFNTIHTFLEQCVNVVDFACPSMILAGFLNPHFMESHLNIGHFHLPSALSHASSLSIKVMRSAKSLESLVGAIGDARVDKSLLSRVHRLDFVFLHPMELPDLRAFPNMTHLALSDYMWPSLTPIPSYMSQVQCIAYFCPPFSPLDDDEDYRPPIPDIEPSFKWDFEQGIFHDFIFNGQRRALALQLDVTGDSEHGHWMKWTNGPDLWERAWDYMISETRLMLSPFQVGHPDQFERLTNFTALSIPLNIQLEPRTPYELLSFLHLDYDPDSVNASNQNMAFLRFLPSLKCLLLCPELLPFVEHDTVTELVLRGEITASRVVGMLRDAKLPGLKRLAVHHASTAITSENVFDIRDVEVAVFYGIHRGINEEDLNFNAVATNYSSLFRYIFRDRRIRVLHMATFMAWRVLCNDPVYRHAAEAASGTFQEAAIETIKLAKLLCETHIVIGHRELDTWLRHGPVNIQIPFTPESSSPASLIQRLCIFADLQNVDGLKDILTLLPNINNLATTSSNFELLFNAESRIFRFASHADQPQLTILDRPSQTTQTWPAFPVSEEVARITHLVLAGGAPAPCEWSKFPGVHHLALPLDSDVRNAIESLNAGLPRLEKLGIIYLPSAIEKALDGARDMGGLDQQPYAYLSCMQMVGVIASRSERKEVRKRASKATKELRLGEVLLLEQPFTFPEYAYIFEPRLTRSPPRRWHIGRHDNNCIIA